jgi:hypothetical protein
MMFVFMNNPNDTSLISISRLQYQISQESFPLFQFDMWGSLKLYASTELIPNAASIRKDYERHVMERLPVKNISELATTFPGIEYSKIGTDGGIAPNNTNMTAFGVQVDGILYRGGYLTRNGVYPYKDSMLFPTYSISKIIMSSLGLMTFDLTYPLFRIYDRTISSLIQQCSSELWGDVTLGNTIDMATGNFMNASYEVDYKSEINHVFVADSETFLEKIRTACGSYKRKSKPGTRWVYHTTDNFLISVAMSKAISQVEPKTRTFQQFLINRIYAPLNLSKVFYRSRTTYDAVEDGATNQEIGAYGQFATLDDLSKIARFLNKDEGKIRKVQVLNYEKLKQALQRNDSNHGFNIILPHKKDLPMRYNEAFWAVDYIRGPPISSSSGNNFMPFASGEGGNI